VKSRLRKYSEKHIYFIEGDAVSPILEKLFTGLKEFSIIDLGCGDGRILYELNRKGMLTNAKRIVGVDVSKERIERLKVFCPFAEGLVGDVCDLKIPDGSFDVAISSQVIEHVRDDAKMLREIRRILKPKGCLYISTVIKKPFGMWVYWNWNNGFKLDPTHVREYSKVEDFLYLLRNIGFRIIDWKTDPVNYPLMDLLVRLLIRMNMISPSPDFYLKHKKLRKLRSEMKMRVIGYFTLEVLSQVRK